MLQAPRQRPPLHPRPGGEFICYNCNERGHLRTNCPHPKCMAPRVEGMTPPPPINEGGRDSSIHVIRVGEVSDDEGVEVFVGKREQGLPIPKKKRNLVKRKRRKSSRRKIGLGDFQLGEGVADYDLVRDVKTFKPNITLPQLIAMCPSLRRQWSKFVTRSSRHKKKKALEEVHKVDIELVDDVPIVDAVVKGITVRRVYMDGGATINAMSQSLMVEDLGLRCTEPSSLKIKLAVARG